MDTSTIVGIGGVFATLVFGAIFLHFHDKLKTLEGQADVAAGLRGRALAEWYTRLLASALRGLGKAAGAPFSGKSIGFCFILAMLYAVLSALAGWGGGGSGGLGSLGIFSRREWIPTAVSNVWLAFSIGLLLAGLGILVFPLGRWVNRRRDELTRRGKLWLAFINDFGSRFLAVPAAVVVYVAVAEAVAGIGMGVGAISVAVGVVGVGTGAFALIISAVAVALATPLIIGINNSSLGVLLFWIILPLINTASDYLSLGFSHWLGRKIALDPSHSVIRATLYGLADLVLALAFMVIAAITIPMALGLLQWTTAIDLGVKSFVTEAAADPWGAGLWFGIMILSTLVWTGAHLLITLGAVLFRLYDGAPLDRWAATMIESGKDSLLVKLYLSSKWLVVFLLWCVLVYVFFLLLDGAAHVITTLFGSDKGVIGVLETVALWGADLVPPPSEFRALPAF